MSVVASPAPRAQALEPEIQSQCRMMPCPSLHRHPPGRAFRALSLSPPSCHSLNTSCPTSSTREIARAPWRQCKEHWTKSPWFRLHDLGQITPPTPSSVSLRAKEDDSDSTSFMGVNEIVDVMKVILYKLKCNRKAS